MVVLSSAPVKKNDYVSVHLCKQCRCLGIKIMVIRLSVVQESDLLVNFKPNALS